MKTLFDLSNEPPKKKEPKDFLEVFKKIGYNFYLDEDTNLPTKSVMLLSQLSTWKFIRVLPWVRPSTLTKKDENYYLADYPHINIPAEYLKLSLEERKKATLEYVDTNDLYFLVILPKYNGKDRFWLGSYSDIPEQYWKLNWRTTSRGEDRLVLSGYKDYKFKKIDELKEQLDNLFKDED